MEEIEVIGKIIKEAVLMSTFRTLGRFFVADSVAFALLLLSAAAFHAAPQGSG